MNADSLCLPMLCFLHPLGFKSSALALLVGLAFWKASGGESYDQFLERVKLRFERPASDYCLVITPRKIETKKAVIYWPSPFEVVHPMSKGIYGLVIIETGTGPVLGTSLLQYAFESLCYGGKLLVMRGNDVLMTLEKN